ncbi:MAG TPA: hypothetical protein VKD47_06615 [Miltoncostaeaceae bacterium]|nr:hypothetical protein [Miltoncostaeaceae bacterium]
MEALEICVVGPPGHGRRALEQTVRRLGHELVIADPLGAVGGADVVVVDAREGLDWDQLSDEFGDPGPVLVLAGEPGDHREEIASRGTGAIVLSGRESDVAYMVAFKLCAALRRSLQGNAHQAVSA